MQTVPCTFTRTVQKREKLDRADVQWLDNTHQNAGHFSRVENMKETREIINKKFKKFQVHLVTYLFQVPFSKI
jgi:hypothetical protein